ncbi:methyltransferase family protein [Catenulispora rubra]|uniref:methyltransferase family protein n=1 Tax=Catenulispora rubra TaxID=280293 RepID=UPI001892055B|nr:isoprenylcysteine carboxylmethyltransferase family protein [Catenulispora rubra]
MPSELSPEIAALLAVSAIWLAVESRQRRRTRPTATKAQDRCSKVLAYAPLAGVGAAALLSWTVPDATIRPPWLIALIGIGALGCGGALRWWCFRTLGDYFTFVLMTSSDQAVITSGPYRIVRHPSYAGLILTMVGAVTMMSNWLSLGVAAVTTVVSLIAGIKVEEEVLHRELGDAYQAYAAATPHRLIPFVW